MCVCVCVRYIDERKGENVNSAEGYKCLRLVLVVFFKSLYRSSLTVISECISFYFMTYHFL